MDAKKTSPLSSYTFRCLTVLLCVGILLPGDSLAWVPWQEAKPAEEQGAPKLPPEQLDSLVAPIALFPDPLLAQVLAASTYPLEIIQLQQWLAKNQALTKDQKKLEEAVKKQPWDPSIQAMAALPDVVKRLADDVQWTTDLGNAFLAQQSDVMDAVQRMRKKAQDKGNLKSTEQQKVETKVVETKQVIVVQQAKPEVVYVPSYDPVVVYGPPPYPYPPIYYPPPPPAGWYAAGAAISFGVGMMVGAAWGGGSWGWGCGWGHNDIDIDVNNNFNRNTNISNSGNRNISGGNRTNVGSGNTTWQHNSQHRGAAPYSNSAVANKYGGTARGDSVAARQASARQNIGAQGSRAQAGAMDRSAGGVGGANRAGASAGTMDRGAGGIGGANRAGASAGTMDRSRGSGGAGVSSMDRSAGGGGDRIGGRSLDSSGSRGNSAFGGASSRSGSSARASSSRGMSSMGGGGRRGGGGGRRR